MQQQIPDKEELKNNTVEELKAKLKNMGVTLDQGRKSKKVYIDMIINERIKQNTNTNNKTEETHIDNTDIKTNTKVVNNAETFKEPMPIKRFKLKNKMNMETEYVKIVEESDNNSSIANMLSNPINGDSTKHEDMSFNSESYLNSNLNNNIQYNSINKNNYNTNMNGTDNIKSENRFLQNKRLTSDSGNPNILASASNSNYNNNLSNYNNHNTNHNLQNILHSSNNKYYSNNNIPQVNQKISNSNLKDVAYKSEISKKYSAMKQDSNVFKQPTPVMKFSNNKSFTNTNNKQLTAASRLSDKNVSSKSLKGFTNITNTVINDAFNNANIDFKETLSQSGVRPYRANSNLSASRISTNQRKQKALATLLPQFSLAKENGELDFPLIMRLLGGSLTVYGFAYYFFKFGNETSFNLENIINFTNENSEIILQGTSVVLVAALIILVYFYFKNRSEYKDCCENLAKICYEDTINYFEEKEMENSQHHICEDSLITQLSKTFDLSEEKFKKNVYVPYLKKILLADERFVLKDLVEDGEIKAFYIYNGDMGFIDQDNNDLNLNY